MRCALVYKHATECCVANSHLKRIAGVTVEKSVEPQTDVAAVATDKQVA